MPVPTVRFFRAAIKIPRVFLIEYSKYLRVQALPLPQIILFTYRFVLPAGRLKKLSYFHDRA
jgi:hypothetical protein